MNISETLIREIVHRIVSVTQPERIILFGSASTGQMTKDSDIDLLVVGELGLRETARRLRPAQDTLGREITPVVWTRQEFERRRREGDPFLQRLLQQPTLAVSGTVPESMA